MHTINGAESSAALLEQLRNVMSGGLPDGQKKEKLRLLGKKIFEIIRATSINDSDLFRQADALKHATDRMEETDITLVREITDIIQGTLDPASAIPKEKATAELLSASLIGAADTHIDEALQLISTHPEMKDENVLERLARHLGEKGTLPELHQCLRYPPLAQYGDLLRCTFAMASLQRMRGVDAGELVRLLHGIVNTDVVLCTLCLDAIIHFEEWDHVSLELKDKALVRELIAKTEGETREAVRSFCALGYIRTGTQEAIQEAFTIISDIRHRWCLTKVLFMMYRELTSLRPASFRPLTSKEIDCALTSLDRRIAEQGDSLAEEAKHERYILLERLLFETHDAYGRLDESSQTRAEVEKIDELIDGGRGFDWIVIMKENLREFYEDHHALQEQLKPPLQAIESAYKIARAHEAKSYASHLKGLPESERSLFRAMHNEKIARLIETELQTIKPGSSLLIPTGIFKHGISLELKKTVEGTFTCLLYNTGEGLLRHHQAQGGASALYGKYHPIIWTSISPAALTRDFFQKIASIEDSPDNTMDEFVELLHMQLGKEDKVAAKSMRAYNPQGLESCAYKSIAVFLHTALEEIHPGLYDQYKRETAHRLLQRFDAAFSDELGKKGNPIDDLSKKPEDIPLNVGQLRTLRDRAEKTMERRGARKTILHEFSQAFTGSLPMRERLALLSSNVDMNDEVIAEHFSKYACANGTISQLGECLNQPSLAKGSDVLRSQFVMGSLTEANGVDAKELLQIMNSIENKVALQKLCHNAVINFGDLNYVRLDLSDRAIVNELVGKTEGEIRDAVCSFCALGYLQTGTEAAMREAFALASEIQDSWYREAILSQAKESSESSSSSSSGESE